MDDDRPKFAFFEKVRVVTPASNAQEVYGELGYIAARAQNDDGTWGYGVYIYRDERLWSFGEDELESTGEFDPPDPSSLRASIRVRVDDQGRGILVKPEDQGI